MEEHKVLTGMLLVALVVSVVGTVVTVDRLGDLSVNKFTLTGAATGDGQGNITIDQTVSIDLVHAVINFGSGEVNSTFALLQTNGTGLVSGGNWSINNDEFFIENDGTAKVNITLVSTKASGNDQTSGANAESYICGTGTETQCSENDNTGDVGTATSFAYLGTDDGTMGTGESSEPGSCVTWDVTEGDFNEIALNSTQYKLCGCMNSDDSNNAIAVDLEVGVPKDAPAGLKTATITFTGSSTSEC